MRKSDYSLGNTISKRIAEFENIYPLPGIEDNLSRTCFIEQIIDSTRRIKYVTTIAGKSIDKIFSDPSKKTFDPLMAAVWFRDKGNFDEACWLTFLATHFGKNRKSEWGLLRNVYDGDSKIWSWDRTSSNVHSFRIWLENNQIKLKTSGNFSNHRKYESLNGLKYNGTGAAIQSYVEWVGEGHTQLINKLKLSSGNDSRKLFQEIYKSMSAVTRFGRTGKFDYLTMLGKLRLVNIEPPSTYMSGATGPVRGAQLLFSGLNGNKKSIRELDIILIEFEKHLGLFFGMQVLEDSLCNWQKNPTKYIHFSG